MTTTLPRSATVFAALIAVLLVTGCAPPRYGDTYYYGQARRAQSVELGVVDSVRVVEMQARPTGVGTVGGAALGGIAGSNLGRGSAANTAGAIAGAILGGLAGTAIERDVTRGQGLEVTVRLDSGRLVAVVQEPAEAFRPGDRVRVLSDGASARVTR